MSVEVTVSPASVVSTQVDSPKEIQVSTTSPSAPMIVTEQASLVQAVVQSPQVAQVQVNDQPSVNVSVQTPSGVQVEVSIGAGHVFGGVHGGVFITDVQPVDPAENVSDKEYDFDGEALKSCTTTTELVTVHILAITGHSSYTPVVTVNDQEVVLVETADSPLFLGTIEIDLTGAETIIANHDDGASWQVDVERSVLPQVTYAQFIGNYPGTQTELKENDTFEFEVGSDQEVVAYEIENHGAFKAQSASIAATSLFTGQGVIANRGTTTQELSFRVRVQNAAGSWSAWFESSNTVALNNTYPVITWGAVEYPVSQSALKDAELATVNHTVTSFDTISYTSTQLSVANPSVYEPAKVVQRIGGDYNVSTNNFTVSANRAANNAGTSLARVIKIANIAPIISIGVPHARLRSGGNLGTDAQNYTVTLTANQQLLSAPSLNAPEGTWQGGGFTGSAETWTRALQIHDDMLKGSFDFNSLIAVGLSGIETNVITSGASYVLGGFVFRVLTVAAFPNRSAAIGTTMALSDKLRCTNLSKGPSGSLNFTYQATTDEAVDKYTVTGGDTWYNCDGANASSNTTGTMQIELEELV